LTRKQWDELCLENKVRYGAVAEKLRNRGEEDHLERLQITKDDLDLLKGKFNRLKRERRSEQKDIVITSSETTKKLTSENLDLKDKVDDIQRQINKLNEKIRNMDKNIKQLNHDVEAANDRSDQVRTELSSKITALERENQEIKTILKEYQDFHARLFPRLEQALK
jgi:chromosome segregation ATPase